MVQLVSNGSLAKPVVESELGTLSSDLTVNINILINALIRKKFLLCSQVMFDKFVRMYINRMKLLIDICWPERTVPSFTLVLA